VDHGTLLTYYCVMKNVKRADFPTTNWSLIGKAANHHAENPPVSLNKLLVIYLPAMAAHLAQTWNLPIDQARDYVHTFTADKIVRDDLIAKADRNRGRFRKFLTTALENYVITIIRKEKSKRRSPGDDAIISLDDLNPEHLAEKTTGPAAFDIIWANNAIQETLRRVEHECKSSGRISYWNLFYNRIVQSHLLEEEEAYSYEKLVEMYDFDSPIQASNALLTVKRMFVRLFREVIAEYVEKESLVDIEIAELRSLLTRFSAKK